MGNLHYRLLVSGNPPISSELSSVLVDRMLVANSPGSSNWFKSLRLFTRSNAKNFTQYVKEIQQLYLQNKVREEEYKYVLSGNTPLTVRQCPGIKDLMNNSFLIKFPCDALVQIENSSKAVSVISTSEPNLMVINSHPNEQWHSTIDKHNIMKNKINIKFSFQLQLSTNNIPWIFTNPSYHQTNSPFQVLPGGIYGNYTKSQQLVVNTYFDLDPTADKGTTEIPIKEGDPLAYLVFHKKMNLIQDKSKYTTSVSLKRNWLQPKQVSHEND